MADPYPKERQLARGLKRPSRIRATPDEWLTLRRQKLGTCRAAGLGRCEGRSELHHIVPRSWGGDDVADNLAPLCSLHHRRVTEHYKDTLARLAESLTDGEYAYCIDKLGEGALERLFGAGVRS